jgi:membrane-associated HD superfamily phosphohydrolase
MHSVKDNLQLILKGMTISQDDVENMANEMMDRAYKERYGTENRAMAEANIKKILTETEKALPKAEDKVKKAQSAVDNMKKAYDKKLSFLNKLKNNLQKINDAIIKLERELAKEEQNQRSQKTSEKLKTIPGQKFVESLSLTIGNTNGRNYSRKRNSEIKLVIGGSNGEATNIQGEVNFQVKARIGALQPKKVSYSINRNNKSIHYDHTYAIRRYARKRNIKYNCHP